MSEPQLIRDQLVAAPQRRQARDLSFARRQGRGAVAQRGICPRENEVSPAAFEVIDQGPPGRDETPPRPKHGRRLGRGRASHAFARPHGTGERVAGRRDAGPGLGVGNLAVRPEDRLDVRCSTRILAGEAPLQAIPRRHVRREPAEQCRAPLVSRVSRLEKIKRQQPFPEPSSPLTIVWLRTRRGA